MIILINRSMKMTFEELKQRLKDIDYDERFLDEYLNAEELEVSVEKVHEDETYYEGDVSQSIYYLIDGNLYVGLYKGFNSWAETREKDEFEEVKLVGYKQIPIFKSAR